MTYNQMDWLPWSLKQVRFLLEHNSVDQFIIAEGSHTKQYPARSPDRSWEYLNDNVSPKDGIILVDGARHRSNAKNYVEAQSNLINDVVRMSPKGDDCWMLYLHDDQFLCNNFMRDIKTICETYGSENDLIIPRAYEFAYNFRLYWKKKTGMFLSRLYGDAFNYPISAIGRRGHKQPFEKNHRRIFVMEDQVTRRVFHMGVAMKRTERALMRVNLSVEKGSAVMKNYWYEQMYLKADLDDLESTYQKGTGMFGVPGFYIDTLDVGQPAVVQKLKVYDGPWPNVLNDHPYRDIKDIRII